MDRRIHYNDDMEAAEPLQQPTTSSMMIQSNSRTKLYMATICINFSGITAGCACTWSSPAIPKLINEGLITSAEGSLLTSLLAIGAALGPFLAYSFVDKIGRKSTLILDMWLFLISWAILGLAPLIASSVNIPILSLINIMYVGRFLSGVGVGCMFMVSPLYVTEISDTEVRSALGSLIQLFLVLGFLIEYCIGPYFSLGVLTICSMIPPLATVISFSFIPESPVYLLSKGKSDAALKSLQWFSQKQDVHAELLDIQGTLEEFRKHNICSWYELFTTRGHIKCLAFGIVLVFFQQFSGINYVLFYTQQIFVAAIGSSLELKPADCSIIVGVMFLVISSFNPILTKKFGLKALLSFSSLFSAFFQGFLALYFYLKDEQVDMSSYSWIPLTSVVLYIFSYTVGLGPLTWVLMSEIYSPTMKAKGSAVSASMCWMISFCLSLAFGDVNNFKPYFSFMIFSIFCVLSTLFDVFVLPNTKGMTLQQIQNLMYDR